MTQKKQIAIIGTGISGLSAAWYLANKHPEYDCYLLEAREDSGGCIQTQKIREDLLELGPRIFKRSSNEELLSLIEAIGLSSSLIFSEQKANARYLWTEGYLQKMPQGPIELLRSSYFRPLLGALVKEWSKPASCEDESIWAFGCRRLGQTVAERLLDPMVLGIYAGDYKTLSMQSCFPRMKEWEELYGSLTLGLWKSPKKNKKPKRGLFSLKGGMDQFLQTLISKIPFPVLYGHTVLSVQKKEEGFVLQTNRGEYKADKVIIATDVAEAAKIMSTLSPAITTALSSIPTEEVTVIHAVLDIGKKAFPWPGFGYLIPTKEKERILGAIFDSSLFPEHRFQDTDTHITFMVRGKIEAEYEAIVKRGVELHLQIPWEGVQLKEIAWNRYPHKIPQYILGHKITANLVQKNLPKQVLLLGNYLNGVSVNDCVRNAWSSLALDFEL